MSNNNRITIPIIPYGLRQEETIVQIASALDSVDCLVNDVFQQIENSILKHRQYLSNLQIRSQIVASKVDQLAGKNVATTVYSDHKFPSEGASFDSLFNVNLRPIEKKPDVFIQSKFQHAKNNKTLSKLHFFHVKSEAKMEEEELISEKGLGDIRPDVDSVTSLLLFNTSENLYQKYIFLDPLAINNESKFEPEERKKNDIAAAPTSILTDQIFENRDYDNSFYSPPFVEVPSFNVPLDLPDLPGIAGDLKYSHNNNELPIAPSKLSQGCEKSKTIEDISATDLPVIETQFKKIKEETNSTLHSSSEQATVPPPPPPFPPSDSSVLPPPPPPMPKLDMTPKTETTVKSEGSQNISKVPPPAENVHATLMEAIRKAGGKEKAHLRPVSERLDTNVKSSSASAGNQPFINQLYSALALRRKGISGQNKEGNKKMAIMSRVSELIEHSSDSEEESGGSEVTNDWDD